MRKEPPDQLPGGSILPVGILDRDLAVTEGEQVAARDLDTLAGLLCPRECPFRHPAVAVHKVPRIRPVRVGKCVEHRGIRGSNRLLTFTPLPVNLTAGGA